MENDDVEDLKQKWKDFLNFTQTQLYYLLGWVPRAVKREGMEMTQGVS